MSLDELYLPGIMDTSNSSLAGDFFVPVLNHSVRYDRGVGYFTSGWIKATAQGLVPFIENGGIARWITSPLLNKEDYDAFALGIAASHDEKLFELLSAEADNLIEAIEHEILLALAWMVADQRLIFKMAVPTEKLAGGDFHDKFGIFTDTKGNRLSFNGSYNDTAKGELNYESIKIFKSWEPHLTAFVEEDAKRFNDLWYGRDPNLSIYDLPASIERRIIKYRELGERPYELPPVVKTLDLIQKEPLKLRPYQEEAVQAWIASNFRGIFEMATGTGKTITALFCLKEFFLREPDSIAIVLCPYIHLVTQWKEEIDKFDIDTVLCYGKSTEWIPEFETRIRQLELARKLDIQTEKKLALICTNATFSGQKFQDLLKNNTLPKMLIADEAHNLGTPRYMSKLPPDAEYSLALTATPKRFRDEEGTDRLLEYFGGIIYTVDLYDAIFELEVLSHYTYEIHQVNLTEDEYAEYRELTKQIARLINKNSMDESDSRLNQLLARRSIVLNTASAKIDLINRLLAEGPQIRKTLFYCAPRQLEQVNRLLTRNFRIIIHQITYKETRQQRSIILKAFENDDYHALTAIKCLDEGLDIPAVQCAYILASSSNPREFIQRRGRILRKSLHKKFAKIIDIITAPPSADLKRDLTENEYRTEREILGREFKRIHYFASCADNRNETLVQVYDLASQYDLQHVLLGGDNEY